MPGILQGGKVAFDSDVLIYAASGVYLYGNKIRTLLSDDSQTGKRFGSTLLLPEMLSKPLRLQNQQEVTLLSAYLRRLELLPLSEDIAHLAADLGASYRLKAADAAHLATAVYAGAEVFITNNHKDFKAAQVLELGIIYPAEL